MRVRCGTAAAAVAVLTGLGVFAAPAGAAAVPVRRVVVAGSVPGWATPANAVRRVPEGTRLQVQVALSLRHQVTAERLAVAVSDPGSRRYRRFLTRGEFLRRFAPSRGQVARVRRWLAGAGLDVVAVSGNRHFVTAAGTAGDMRVAFGTGLVDYRWAGHLLRAPSGPVTVPAGVADTVTAVLGLDTSAVLAHPEHVLAHPLHPARTVPEPAGAPPTAQPDTRCAAWWAQHDNPAVPHLAALQSNVICGYAGHQIQHLYGVGGPGQDGAGGSVAVVDAYASSSMAADVDRYSRAHGLPVPAAGQYTESLPDRFVTDPSCEPPSEWAVEEALDVEAVHTTAPAAHITYVGARSCLTLFDGVNTAVDAHLGDVVSNSWGMRGEDVPAAARRQADAIFVQAALTGISVVFSSGDNGDNQGNPADGHPQPDWPASSPWVTAVGGTSVGVAADDSVVFRTGWESQIDQLGSTGEWAPLPPPAGPFAGGAGGGPSHLYPEPSWQDGVVPDRLAGGHRVVPDIAGLADPATAFAVELTVGGVDMAGAIGGTSLACPLVAGILADTEQATGARLGLATPALYSTAGLTDVVDVHAAVYSPTGPVTGSDFLFETDRATQTLHAGAGFDPVTGLGVPHGTALLTPSGR